MRAGFSILQTQDHVIVQGAGSICQGIHQQVTDIFSKQVTNGSILLNHKNAIVKLQEENKSFSERQDNMEEVIERIQKFLEKLPTKSDLLKRIKSMDESLAIIQEVSTGLTIHMEEY